MIWTLFTPKTLTDNSREIGVAGKYYEAAKIWAEQFPDLSLSDYYVSEMECSPDDYQSMGFLYLDPNLKREDQLPQTAYVVLLTQTGSGSPEVLGASYSHRCALEIARQYTDQTGWNSCPIATTDTKQSWHYPHTDAFLDILQLEVT